MNLERARRTFALKLPYSMICAIYRIRPYCPPGSTFGVIGGRVWVLYGAGAQ